MEKLQVCASRGGGGGAHRQDVLFLPPHLKEKNTSLHSVTNNRKWISFTNEGRIDLPVLRSAG